MFCAIVWFWCCEYLYLINLLTKADSYLLPPCKFNWYKFPTLPRQGSNSPPPGHDDSQMLMYTVDGLEHVRVSIS